MKPKISAIYVSVQNMDRAIAFYEKIFKTPVSSRDKRMSSFDFDHLSLLLFDPTADGETATFGNNVVPTIEVENVEEMFKIVEDEKCPIVMPLETIDSYRIFQIKDTEGNILEFYENIKE